MYRTIFFRNGKSHEVPLEIANKLRDLILSGSPKFQTFTDTKGNLFLMVNVEEISHIV